MQLDALGYDFVLNKKNIHGYSMNFIDIGEGEPIVMLHGNPSWSFYYRDLITALHSKYRTIAIDHIGCGLSEKPSEKIYAYTLQQRIDDLSTFLASLRINKNITLVLHDWGGAIGMAYAMAHPKQIARLIILNTAAFPLPTDKKLPLLLQIARSPLGKWLILNLNAFARGTAWIGCKNPRMSKILRDAYCAPYDSPKHRIALWKFVEDIPIAPSQSSFQIITRTAKNLNVFSETPSLICWGMKDFVFDKKILQQWKKYFSHAEIHEFHKSGHYILEDAKEEVIPLIHDFLTSNPLGAAI